MKTKLFYLFLLFSAIISCNEIEQKKDFSMEDTVSPDKITIAFYNVENLFDTKDDPLKNDNDFTPTGYKSWNDKRYYKKLDNIARVINALNKKEWPVIVGLAEVENKTVLEALTKENDLVNAQYKFIHFESPDSRGIDVALLYRPDLFHVMSKKAITIFNPKFPNSKTRDILYVKGNFYNGEVFHFLINHWSSRRKGTLETEPKRIFQAIQLKKEIEKIQIEDPAAKIIIMGDFNDYPNNKSITEYLKANTSDIDLYNLAYSLHEEDKGTINYKDDWGMFDQIIVSQSVFKNGLHLKTNKQNILSEDWLLWKGKKPNRTYGGKKYYGGYSDHLPTFINLEE